jgi:hypothetical protein
MKVIFATPSLHGPTAPYVDALERSIPLITAAGFEEGYAQEVGCPYISAARATLTRRALDAGADVIVYLDYDLSWRPSDLLKLLETDGDVVAGTYRFKQDAEEYMGVVRTDALGRPLLRHDGAIVATRVPAGFLKVTRAAIDRFMQAYPALTFGRHEKLSVDLFNHGAHDGVWWGEDYAFCRNWCDCGGEIALVPDLAITHHASERAYPGNFHQFLLRQPQPEQTHA